MLLVILLIYHLFKLIRIKTNLILYHIITGVNLPVFESYCRLIFPIICRTHLLPKLKLLPSPIEIGLWILVCSIKLRLVLRLFDDDEELAVESDEWKGRQRRPALQRAERGLIPDNIFIMIFCFIENTFLCNYLPIAWLLDAGNMQNEFSSRIWSSGYST